MSKLNSRRRNVPAIDLAAIRDTLLYIESDVAGAAGFERLAKAVQSTLAEIERLESFGEGGKRRSVDVAQFVPIDLK